MITGEFRKTINNKGVRITAELSGIPLATIGNWVYAGNVPSIVNAEKVLNALGYELKIIKKGGN